METPNDAIISISEKSEQMFERLIGLGFYEAMSAEAKVRAVEIELDAQFPDVRPRIRGVSANVNPRTGAVTEYLIPIRNTDGYEVFDPRGIFTGIKTRAQIIAERAPTTYGQQLAAVIGTGAIIAGLGNSYLYKKPTSRIKASKDNAFDFSYWKEEGDIPRLSFDVPLPPNFYGNITEASVPLSGPSAPASDFQYSEESFVEPPTPQVAVLSNAALNAPNLEQRNDIINILNAENKSINENEMFNMTDNFNDEITKQREAMLSEPVPNYYQNKFSGIFPQIPNRVVL